MKRKHKGRIGVYKSSWCLPVNLAMFACQEQFCSTLLMSVIFPFLLMLPARDVHWISSFAFQWLMLREESKRVLIFSSCGGEGKKPSILSFKAKVAYLVSYSGSDPDENSSGCKIFAQVYSLLTSDVCLSHIQLIRGVRSWILTLCNFSSWKLKLNIWKSDTFRSAEASWKPIQDTALGHHIQTSLNF